MTISQKIAECEKGCGKHIDNAYDDGDRYYDGTCGEEGFCEECLKFLSTYKEAQDEIDELKSQLRNGVSDNVEGETVKGANHTTPIYTKEEMMELKEKINKIIDECKIYPLELEDGHRRRKMDSEFIDKMIEKYEQEIMVLNGCINGLILEKLKAKEKKK